MLIGCIADDLTGATDIANAFVAAGLSTLQLIGPPKRPLDVQADAVVVALKSRSIEPAEAVQMSITAMRRLQDAGCTRFYFKYCSTFDSTPRGNIGPVLEAMAEALGASAVVACPAFPATGRTIYQGHLFVGDRLLNESGMERHPLTPMTDANLVRVLQAQMRSPVALLPHSDIAGGRIGQRMAAHAAAGVGAVIADAVDDQDLDLLGAHCATAPLASGGSGLGAGIARALKGPGAGRASARLPAGRGGRRAVVAGSCSAATQRQVEIAAHTLPAFRVALKTGQTPSQLVDEAKAWIDSQDPLATLLVYSTASAEAVAAQRAAWQGDVSAALEEVLAELAAHLVAVGAAAVVVAGGETSGAVVQRLGCEQLEIGPEIDPGVPWTIAHRPDGPPLLLALKSGNFGADDFMTKAWGLLT